MSRTHKNPLKSILVAVIILTSRISTDYMRSGAETRSLFEDENETTIPDTSDVFEQGILYSGQQDSILINETALYNEFSPFIMGNGTNPLYTSQLLEFPLDDINSWEGYQFSANITNLVDEQNWISNSGFGSDEGVAPATTITQTYQSSHSYSNNLDPDPSISSNIISTIDGSGSDYMRIHFANISIEGVYDTIYLWDQDNVSIGWYSGLYNDLLTPWMEASVVKITMETDGSTTDYGYYIDYYDTYDGTLFTYNMDDWTAYAIGSDLSEMNAVAGHQLNSSAINITLAGTHQSGRTYRYSQFEESVIYQELSIPRGEVENAWISFDYYPLRVFPQSKIEVVAKINEDIIYVQNLATISSNGLAQWHDTGLISIPTALFTNPVSEQTINFSIGIFVHNTRDCTGDFADLQEIYLDNIELIVKAQTNSSQSGIDLQFEGNSPIDSVSTWGSSTINLLQTWTTSPVEINITTDSEKIEFNLESSLYAYHIFTSTQEEYGDEGTILTINTDNTIEWETYFRAYIPLYYNDYEFSGSKPFDWRILEVYNPIGTPVTFNGGDRGESTFTVPHPTSDLPGWWYFKAESTNMINATSTEVWNGTNWHNYLTNTIYNIGDTVQIQTSLNSSLGNISNNGTTYANLTIYAPNDVVWNSSSVHPTEDGRIQFPELTIGNLNTTGGDYRYKIIWMNGTSAGGVNGSFTVLRNIQSTLYYPRDAQHDFTIEEVLGDVIPLRVKLNDSLSGEILSDINIEYNWTSGTGNLTEIVQGFYDGFLNTLDLGNPGFYQVNFTIFGEGYYNSSFILHIYLVEETELKVTGLDNNIDYGANFSLEISYTSKHLSYGIVNASVSLNLSSSDYHVYSQAQDGKYLIEISSSTAFSSAGSYDIEVNATIANYQEQILVTRIQILPRSVYFEILLDSSDCSFNKSYSTIVKQNINISIAVLSSADNSPVNNGTIYISEHDHIHDDFVLVGDYFFMEFNTSHLGLGIHFISIVYNETTYQSASEIIMVSVSRLGMNAGLVDLDTTEPMDRNKDFEVIIFVEDPITHTPITDVTIAYDWVYGRGFLTNLGDGYYLFEDTVPNDTGPYEIVFTVSSPNADYEPSTIIFLLVSQYPDTFSNLWWFLITVGAIALIATGTLGVIAYRRKILLPKREEAVNKLKKKTQVFDDITNIKSILIIETGTGRLMYQQNFGGLNSDLEDIFSGFLHSILTLSNKFALQNGELGDKQEYAEFTHEAFHVLVASGEKILLALILEDESSPELQERAFKFIDEFEGIYHSVFGNWVGDRKIFRDTTPKLFEEIFHLSLLERFMLSEVQNVHLLEKTLVTPGTISERIAQIIKAVSEERHDFRLRTLISLVPKEEQLEAKEIILHFIKNHYLIPVKDSNT